MSVLRHHVIGRLIGSVVVAGVAVGLLSAGGSADTAPPSDRRATPDVIRISAPDRYQMAALLALRTRPTGAGIVYVASGANYPDALSAGPAAMHRRGALLLVQPDRLSPEVASALTTLNPTQVLVAGGPASVSDSVVAALAATVPRATVSRIAGADRYEMSRAVSEGAFAPGLATSFVVTGRSFPDALSVGAVAGLIDAPVLLVDGSLPGIDIPTARTIDRLRVSSILIAGGPASVSAGAESSLALVHDVKRFSGADRYAVSQAVNDGIPQSFRTVYLVTGENFPDALAGGVLAGTLRSPMYVVPRDCVPQAVLRRIADAGTENVILLGGPASLTDDVAALRPCWW